MIDEDIAFKTYDAVADVDAKLALREESARDADTDLEADVANEADTAFKIYEADTAF